MEVYASEIRRALSERGVETELFTPKHWLERKADSRLVMRYLRYWAYRAQLSKRAPARQESVASVQHVIDHGYAHVHAGLPMGVQAVTVHDLIPFLTWRGRIPGAEKKARKPRLNIHSLNHVRRFDRVITVSNSSANDIHRELSIPRQQISVVPPIIGDHFQPQDLNEVADYRQRLSAENDTKLVLLSGREYYKNHGTSLQVIKQLLAQGHKIKIIRIGQSDREFIRLVERHGLKEQTESVFIRAHTELPLLYSAADCLLFPSWYEGFGMPVAEALACGTCVVSSDTASLPEVGGPLALRSAPDDVAGLARQLELCLFDSAHQRRVSQHGEQWVQQFRAPALVDRLLQAYNA